MLDGDALPSGGAPLSPPPARPSGQGGSVNAVGQSRMPAGNGGGQAMRLVERQEAAPTMQTAPAPVEQPEEVPVRSLADIVALATANRDVAFRALFKRCVRLVRIEPGTLEIGLTDDAPRDLAGQIGDRLKTWTGRRWIVSVSRGVGGPTLAEDESSKRESAIMDARADPAVAAILAKFPGAKIIDIRIPDAPDDPASGQAPAQEAGLEAVPEADEDDDF